MAVLLDEADPSSLHTLIFRLAPLRLMPLSVYLFLSQIAEGVWSRGTPAFVLRADHVLQACPHPCLDQSGALAEGDLYADLRQVGLESVSFQEYSPEFPHKQYTLGFAGRPRSGPEFYINLLDNSRDHGTPEKRKIRMGAAEDIVWDPKVAAAHEAEVEPYPCFGEMIEGFDTVNEMAKGMTRGDMEEEDTMDVDEHMLLRPVRIKSMTILENYNPATTEDDVKRNKRRPTANDEF